MLNDERRTPMKRAPFTKAVRRELEPVWAADTQRRIKAMGLWPTNLSGENE